MRETIPVLYTKCGFCTARNHCDDCSREISQALAEKEDILCAEVNLKAKTLDVTYTIDRDMLEDILDGMGVMAD